MYDEAFLKQLDYQKEKDIYIRITSLSYNDYPREQIEGRSTGGSVNVDGSSAVRRSCQLSMVALEEDTIITDDYWSYNNKFKLEVGLKNLINKKYPDIIWFNMGIYIITNFSKNWSTTGLNISLSGKDKMCRLNGEVNGSIMSTTDFAGYYDVSSESLKKVPLKQIIQSAVMEYAGENLSNIIINDLEENGYQLYQYNGDTPLYLFIKTNTKEQFPEVINITLNGKVQVNIVDTLNNVSLMNFETGGYKYYSFSALVPEYNNDATKIYYGYGESTENGEECYLAKIEAGETVGYIHTDLIYPGELVLNPGDAITSMLDKIITMLGNYEYFYDINGRFIFQKKKDYVQEPFSTTVLPSTHKSQYSYKFEDTELFTALSISPNLNNLKNDFAIWGARKSASGADIPIHVRYAIDKKPTQYITYTNISYSINKYDWRELIYQMAIDFSKYGLNPDFVSVLQKNNPWVTDGKTGYENYYTDIRDFWRELYNPDGDNKQYYSDYIIEIDTADGKKQEKVSYPIEYRYWNKEIFSNPTAINFWFDFVEAEGELEEFSVKKIGARAKALNENQVKSISYKETPEIVFTIPSEGQGYVDKNSSFIPMKIPNHLTYLFSISTQGLAAEEKITQLLYQHVGIIEGINITSIPIYYLQPNTRIFIKDKGDYVLDKIQYNLNYNGTMNISANKILKQFC